MTIQYDVNDEFIWYSKYNRYSDADALLEREIVYDTGLVRHWLFEQTGQTVTTTDVSAPDGGFKIWSEQQKNFDPFGNLIKLTTTFDDGVVTVEDYDRGAVTYRVKTDLGTDGSVQGAYAWRSKENLIETYNYGTWVTDTVTWDTGVKVDKRYLNGELRTITKTDLASDDAPDGMYNWEVQTETFFSASNITKVSIKLDNGVLINKTLSDGRVVSKTQEDLGNFNNQNGTQDWEFKRDTFNFSAQTHTSHTLYDTGDVTAVVYENDIRRARLQIDHDDTQDWFIRETVYDAAGDVEEIITFDSKDDMSTQQIYDYINEFQLSWNWLSV